jgi:hypothetical protein
MPQSRVTKILFLAVALLAQIAWGGAPAQAPVPAPPELVFAPFHEDGIYKAGEVAGWTVTRSTLAAMPSPSYTYTYTASKNNLDVIKTGTIAWTDGRATIEVTTTEPGMLYVQVTRDGGKPMSVGAAIEPRKIGPAVPRPADFDEFWAGKLAALAAVPSIPCSRRSRRTSPAWTPTRSRSPAWTPHMQGYLARPSREGSFRRSSSTSTPASTR